ncbi:VanZ family protein [Xanthovirga aplysinae]|uniref:VanZ family protein n=1 Tax=Xanthovirga aplysinae TaxID=2529853 RepID=UPI0012BD606C|nr:VanZ family protein [Xanthovirga aplysinae]MTI30710.1 VanZ family protein [Xanthovirga aplysinae]
MFFRHNIFAFILIIIIIGLSLSPGNDMPDISEGFLYIDSDKVAHFSFYCILTFMLIVGFTKQYTYPRLRYFSAKYSLLFAASLGVILELLQGVMSERSIELNDILVNTLGAFFGLGIFYLIYKI